MNLIRGMNYHGNSLQKWKILVKGVITYHSTLKHPTLPDFMNYSG